MLVPVWREVNYDDRYFLREIWTEGARSGRQFPKRKLESELAMNNSPEHVVVLAELK